MIPKRVSKQKRGNEYTGWQALSDDQKTFAVRLLHFFHFRPDRTFQSWRQEETITWELVQALELLPKSVFLSRVIAACATASRQAVAAAAPLQTIPADVTVVAFPNLGLTGRKQNKKSDIGFSLRGEPRIWLEVKTAVVRQAILSRQLEDQRKALRRLTPRQPTAVVALLPDSQVIDTESPLRWCTITRILGQSIDELSAHPDAEMLTGQIRLVDQLRERIRGHQPRLVSE